MKNSLLKIRRYWIKLYLIVFSVALYSQDYCYKGEVIHIHEDNYLRMDWYYKTGKQYSGGNIVNKKISKYGGDDILTFQVRTINNVFNAKMFYDNDYKPFLLELDNKEYLRCEDSFHKDNLLPEKTINGVFRYNGQNPHEHSRSNEWVAYRDYSQANINQQKKIRTGTYPYFIDVYDYSSQISSNTVKDYDKHSKNSPSSTIGNYNTNTYSDIQKESQNKERVYIKSSSKEEYDDDEISPGLNLLINIGKNILENEIDNFVNGKNEWVERKMVIKCKQCETVVSRYVMYNERLKEIKEDPDDPLPKTSWWDSHNHTWVKANN